ncbi:shikimate kinase [Microbacterium sp.]|uniref:shikimate kinase n=1 Tax=Microbacterium sp. TaxID=51671 RepID=UPI003A8C47B6
MSAAGVVLIGPMGAGKTSVGRRVARRLGERFVDTDVAFVRAHGKIEDVFTAHGEDHFRALERQIVAEHLADGGVIALGGGAVLHPGTQTDLARHRVVLLTVAPERIASRIRGSTRPLLQSDDPLARWRAVWEQRRPLYERLADVMFDTSEGPLSDVVDAVVDWAQHTEETR